jgi:hypothetical protein
MCPSAIPFRIYATAKLIYSLLLLLLLLLLLFSYRLQLYLGAQSPKVTQFTS